MSEQSSDGTDRTDAYCPHCKKELKPSEYCDTNGCSHCGHENIWLSQDAFLRIFKSKFPNHRLVRTEND